MCLKHVLSEALCLCLCDLLLRQYTVKLSEWPKKLYSWPVSWCLLSMSMMRRQELDLSPVEQDRGEQVEVALAGCWKSPGGTQLLAMTPKSSFAMLDGESNWPVVWLVYSKLFPSDWAANMYVLWHGLGQCVCIIADILLAVRKAANLFVSGQYDKQWTWWSNPGRILS